MCSSLAIHSQRSSSASPSSPPSEASTCAQHGDIVTIDLELTPEGDDFVPERLFDTHGKLTFILGWGNYLPAIHELIKGMRIGDTVESVSVDAGWGEHRDDLVIAVPKTNFKKLSSVEIIKVGDQLNLKDGIRVKVVNVTDDTIIVDGNHPMAGSSYSCSLKVLNIESCPSLEPSSTQKSKPSRYQVSTWALGCFWGGELAFSRVPGVVGTRAGYTMGTVSNPTYEEVCTGETQHREAVMVVYDTDVVSYEELMKVYFERLAATTSQYKLTGSLFDDEEESLQYKHGIYYHNKEQHELAVASIQNNNNFYSVEIKEASSFFPAEEYHQQYLLKGGQSARKGARETIRCFG
jgi:peptide-methionine (S)-S-oxide reductase